MPATQRRLASTMNSSTHDFNILDADGVRDNGSATIAQSDKAGDRPCYLTFDIDFLDPAYAPGTEYPYDVASPLGGANAYLVIFVGADLVEVSPPFDHAEITALAGLPFCWMLFV